MNKNSLLLLGKGIFAHYKKWWPIYLLTSILALWFSHNYKFAINVTNSLPGTVYLIVKNELPLKNQPMAFVWHDTEKKTPFPDGVTFLKLAGGVAGDVVLRGGDDSQILVNEWRLQPKKFSKTGLELAANGFLGKIPQGYYFAVGTHKDSLDSRYAMVGLIPSSQVIGKAYALF